MNFTTTDATTETPAVVLGRFAVRYARGVVADQPHIVMAWRFGGEGRKHRVGTVIYTADGVECATARATWIEVDPGRINR